MQFRGFLIQARLMSDDTTAVGSFSSPPAGARLSSCTPPEVYLKDLMVKISAKLNGCNYSWLLKLMR